jgi:hypothetical protein
MAQEPSPANQAAMQAMMEAFEKYAAIGPQHRGLARRAGSWKVKASFWSDPGAPPVTSDGTSEATMIMDGRFVMEKFEMATPDGPFKGLGIVGFDNIRAKYQSVWIDMMSTGVMFAEGSGDDAARSIDYRGEEPDPVAWGYKPYRSVEAWLDDRTRRLETFESAPDGGEFKVMELLYTRK